MWILLSKPPAQVQGDLDSQHNDAMNWNGTNTIEKRSFASRMQMYDEVKMCSLWCMYQNTNEPIIAHPLPWVI